MLPEREPEGRLKGESLASYVLDTLWEGFKVFFKKNRVWLFLGIYDGLYSAIVSSSCA